MNFTKFLFVFVVAGILCVEAANAQNRPIGSWRSFLPYNSAIGIATDGNTIYTVCEQSYYTYNTLSGQVDAYSKVEGMSDIGMQCVGYDLATSTAILAYTNGNIDLFKDNTFYNIPDLKIRTIAGAKTIFSVYAFNGYAYLSTSIGVIVIDLTKRNVKETYEYNVNSQIVAVRGFYALGDYFYAATERGIFRAARNSPELQNYQAWQVVDTSMGYTGIAGYGNELFASTTQSVYRVNDSPPSLVYTSAIDIEHIDGGMNSLFICEYDTAHFNGSLKIYNTLSGMVDSAVLGGKRPLQATQMLDSTIWIADQFGGALKRSLNKELGYFAPAGPLSSNSYDIYANNKDLWIAHGGYNDLLEPAQDYSGIANYKDDKWTYYQRYVYRPFDTLTDFCSFLKDEVSGVIYAGSYKFGLFVINPDGTSQLYNQTSIFDPSASLGANFRQVTGMALDSKRDLWVSTMFSQHQLYVKTPDNSWYKFKVPDAEYGGAVVVDDNDQVWFSGYLGGGVNVFDSKGTFLDESDDTHFHFAAGKGFGNLPSNTISCLAKDNNNNIWVGTPNGIGIINNCTSPFNPACEAEIPIVQYDQYAGYLFAGNSVRTIAVDGANRKWVGTEDGVWLLSPDAAKIIYRFTTDNSPLPSNKIQKISIDKVTGDVYIGTEKGLISYRSTATEGGKSNSNVLTFPNPVPSGYSGTIAIKGLVTNADVRITDINGQLVYRTKALGGQAVWNGMDYTGHKPQSGVYLIFVSDASGEEMYTGKLVFLK